MKKQTAIRLAQEQEQTRLFPNLLQPQAGGELGFKILPDQQDLKSQPHTHRQQVAADRIDVKLQGTSAVGHNTGNMSTGLDSSGNDLIVHKRHVVHPLQPLVQYHHHGETPRAEPIGGSIPSSTRHAVDAHGRYNPGSTLSSGSSSFSVVSTSATTHSHLGHCAPNKQSSKSKLPHGLTVKELKEMTKARLQNGSQAPDSVDQSFIQPMLVHREPSPSYLHRHHQATEVSSRPHMLQHHPPGFAPTNRVLPQSLYDQHLPTVPSRFQPYPSNSSTNSGGFLPEHNQGAFSQVRDSWQPKPDTWDTVSVASVNSTIGSEYYGSESAYGGIGDDFSEVSFTRPRSYRTTCDDFNETPFARTRSFPSGPGLCSDQDVPSSFATGGLYFDMAMQSLPNRRRACTLSPRPGLLHLHEDRPLERMSGVPELTIPTYDDSHRTQSVPRHSSVEFDARARSYSGGGAPNETMHGQLNGFSGQLNRPRTSSAPTITSSYINGGVDNIQDSESFSRLFTGGMGNFMINNVLQTGDSCHSAGNEFASVFRNPVIPSDTMSYLESPSSGILRSGTNPWASGHSASYTTSASADDNAAFAKDLGAMLQLNGHEQIGMNDDFVHNIDPEVSLLSSLREGIGGSSDFLYSDLGVAMRDSPFNQGPSFSDKGSNNQSHCY